MTLDAVLRGVVRGLGNAQRRECFGELTVVGRTWRGISGNLSENPGRGIDGAGTGKISNSPHAIDSGGGVI